MNVWHYHKNGQSVGPIDEQELLRLVRAGDIGPDDSVWGGGQTEWTPARDVPGLFAPPRVGTPMAPANRAAGPAPVSPARPLVEQESDAEDLGEAFERHPHFFSPRGRLGRLPFFLQMAALVALLLVYTEMWGVPTDHPVHALVFVAALILIFFVQSRRLHDIGHPGTAVWFNLAPGVNVFLQVYLLLRPGTHGLNRFGPDPRNTSSTEGRESVIADVAQLKDDTRRAEAARRR